MNHPENVSGRAVLRRAVTGQWRRVAAAAALGAGHQAGEALVPVLVGVVIDRAVATSDGAALGRWLLVLAVVFAGLSTSYRLSARATEAASERAAHAVRIALVRRVLDPRGGAETGRLPGALVNIATGDARRVGLVNWALAGAVAAVCGLVVGAVALLRVSVPLGLVVLLGAPPLLWLSHVLSKPLERRSEAEQEQAARASGLAADLVAGLRVLKGIGAEPTAVERYRRTSRLSLAATLRAARAEAWQGGAMLTLTGLFIALVALVGGRLAAQGDISVGELVAAVGLAQLLLSPLMILSFCSAEFAQARASAGRVAEVLGAPHAVAGGSGALPVPVRGELRVSGVTLGPLRGLSLTVRPGELLGVVTPDPAAASALVRCLGREADPDAGTVRLDGVDLTSVEPAEVRASVVVAAHDADLFEGTLLENVLASSGDRPGADRALAAATADEVAAALPAGVDTVLDERGRSLSGGQRQRVALARALAADAPVLVVHDPTTAVDAVTEARIAEGLRDLRRGRTTIVIATSPALLATADRVVIVEDGDVRAEGTHAELVRDHAAYRAAVLG
ncbi:MAG TPA: ABC transporter ATP-binding protein [Thermomonospora sp.]|nr:ABC transporter ATP-binding protein [Thermomonospora sp.]